MIEKANLLKVMEREGLHSEHAAQCFLEAKRKDTARDKCTKAWKEIEQPEQRRAQLVERADMECNLHNFGEAGELGKQIDVLDAQLICKHEWKGDNSGMQLSTTYCEKCGASYAC